MIRATQGDMPIVEEPSAGDDAIRLERASSRAHARDARARSPAPRRGDPVPPPGRLLRQRHGRLEGAGERIEAIGPRMAPSAGSRTATSGRPTQDWPYSVFTMPTGARKEECDAVLDAIAGDTGISRAATLYSSTEFKKIRLLYFTDEFRDWESRPLVTCVRGRAADRRERRSLDGQGPRRRAAPDGLRSRKFRRHATRRSRPRTSRAPAPIPSGGASTRPSARCARSGAIRCSSSRARRRRDRRRRRQPLRRLRLLVGGDRSPATPTPAVVAASFGGGARAARASARRPRRGRARRGGGARGCRSRRCCG